MVVVGEEVVVGGGEVVGFEMSQDTSESGS